MNNSAQKPRRFAFLSVRTILLLATVISLSAGWLILRIQTKRSEAAVALAIEDLNGFAWFDEEVDGKPATSWFRRLKAVGFYARSDVRDADLALLLDLSALEEVFLSDVQITDNGALLLGQLKNLRSLQLSNTLVTDAGLRHLHGLTNLKWLDLSGTNTTESGVQEVQQAIPHCEIEY